MIDEAAYTVRKLGSMFDEHADASLVVSELRQLAKPAWWIHNLVACGGQRERASTTGASSRKQDRACSR